jgi:hypothetical protein
MRGIGSDQHPRPGLDIGTNPDGQIREALHAIVVSHAGRLEHRPEYPRVVPVVADDVPQRVIIDWVGARPRQG